MSFFDTKEEVLDVQLTQFGKRLLSLGQFRPAFYAFFDDDVLYDSEKAGFKEHQNSTQKRIIEETPKLKTQHLTTGIATHFDRLEDLGIRSTTPRDAVSLLDDLIVEENEEEDSIAELVRNAMNNIIDLDSENAPGFGFGGMEDQSGLLDPLLEAGRAASGRYDLPLEQFRNILQVRKNHDYDVQEKILLYPLGSQEVANTQAPSYDAICLDSPIEFKGYQHFTSFGIIKNVPQFDAEPKIELIKNTSNRGELRPPSEEEFYDLTSEEVVFRDNTMIQVNKDNLVLDIEELNTMFRKDKFRLQIYEIIQQPEGQQERLEKITDPNIIRALFHIKTDDTISHLHDYKTQREKNYQDRSRD